jgi:hypothetical protein
MRLLPLAALRRDREQLRYVQEREKRPEIFKKYLYKN